MIWRIRLPPTCLAVTQRRSVTFINTLLFGVLIRVLIAAMKSKRLSIDRPTTITPTHSVDVDILGQGTLDLDEAAIGRSKRGR